MTTFNRPAVMRCRDERGRPVVRVPLDRFGHKWATLDADDFDALPHTLTHTWFLNASGPDRTYVKAGAKDASGRLVRVARVILRARAGQWVAYETPDRTDLRRCNISLRRGGRAKRNDAALTATPIDPWGTS